MRYDGAAYLYYDWYASGRYEVVVISSVLGCRKSMGGYLMPCIMN